ncbi:MAG: Gfo/Idh/MocA family oxidoreductase, partial [Clostridia bacterium]|nr:Gfo/Idh/MocA family oxidoreductase [Clostridia bacterium]
MSDAVLGQFKQPEKEKVISSEGRKFRVGIIGTGWIAESHIESYMNQPDVEIVAAADLIPGKARAKLDHYGLTNVRCYNSHQEL